MKKLFFAAIVALAGWLNSQAQSMPAPERYNDFLEQIAKMDQTRGEFLVNATMETLSKDPKAYRQMMELAEKRFSDPADPIHNEGFYMAVLKHVTENFILSGSEIEKQRLLLEGAKKNMVGSVATDFDYVTPGDKTEHRLKELKADNILIYFNNPDCESCEVVKNRLASSELINKLVNEKKLVVLAIYPYDDQKLWKKASYPKMMINGWNKSRKIEYAELYDLPTLPCFYLLDKDYKVLAKNEGSLNKIEALLNGLSQAQVAGPTPMSTLREQGKAPATTSKIASTGKVTANGESKTKVQSFDINPDSKPAQQPRKHPGPDRGPATPTPAPADDPNTARSEQMLNYLISNQGAELYANLADDLKQQTQPEKFDNAITSIESKLGKYQSHQPWNIQSFHGAKAYTSLMKFENSEAGLVIIYDEKGKMLGFSVMPAEAIKH